MRPDNALKLGPANTKITVFYLRHFLKYKYYVDKSVLIVAEMLN